MRSCDAKNPMRKAREGTCFVVDTGFDVKRTGSIISGKLWVRNRVSVSVAVASIKPEFRAESQQKYSQMVPLYQE